APSEQLMLSEEISGLQNAFSNVTRGFRPVSAYVVANTVEVGLGPWANLARIIAACEARPCSWLDRDSSSPHRANVPIPGSFEVECLVYVLDAHAKPRQLF